MGESNADSTIALKLNRLDRRRPELPLPVTPSINALTNAFNDPALKLEDVLSGAGALAAAYGTLQINPPVKTAREHAHMDDVPSDIIFTSKKIFSEIYNRRVSATFSAVFGDVWEVEIMTHVVGGTSPHMETSITWVNPSTPIMNTTLGVV